MRDMITRIPASDVGTIATCRGWKIARTSVCTTGSVECGGLQEPEYPSTLITGPVRVSRRPAAGPGRYCGCREAHLQARPTRLQSEAARHRLRARAVPGLR